MQTYIATKLENHKKHNAVRDALKKFNIILTYDWTTHDPVYKEGVRRIKEVSVLERLGVVNADFVIIILPGGRGTHTELGMAIALNIPVFILAEEEDVYNNCISAVEGTCAFYHYPNCKVFRTVEQLIDYCKLYTCYENSKT